jgi:HEAT repeat protein
LGLVRLGFGPYRSPGFDLDTVAYRIKALKSKDVAARRLAASYLEEHAPVAEAAIPALALALDDPDAMVAKSAGDALAKTGRATIPVLITALRHKNPQVRLRAAFCLWYYRGEGKEAQSALIETLKRDESPDVRWRAALALGFKGPGARDAVPHLLEALKDKSKGKESDRVCEGAISALEEIGPDAEAAVPTLLGLLAGKDRELRSHAAGALGRIAPTNPAVVRPLIKALNDKEDCALRVGAASSLGLIGLGARDAIPDLIEALKAEGIQDLDTSENLTRLAAWALGQMGEAAKAAVPALTRIFQKKTENTALLTTVAESLGMIGAPAKSAIPVLSAAAENEREDYRLRKAASEAVKRIQGRE